MMSFKERAKIAKVALSKQPGHTYEEMLEVQKLLDSRPKSAKNKKKASR